jgi:diguanylate cyclase (GGDEF)-like protein
VPVPASLPPQLLALLVDRINAGIVTVDDRMTVLQWNRFMEAHTGRTAAATVGQNLFACCPELPRQWLEDKVRTVFQLKAAAFTSWRTRPVLFPVREPGAPDGETMRQDCAFVPLEAEGQVAAVSIVLLDATDSFRCQRRLDAALTDLAAMSERDGLTGVLNRRKLEQVLDTEFVRAARYAGALSVVMVDIDHLKRINDQLGHLVGDETLRHVAGTILSTLRTTDVVGRYGGEEFLVLLPAVGLDGARAAAERMREAVAESAVPGLARPLHATISLGVATFHPHVSSAAALVAHADQALCRAKADGRDRVGVFSGPGAAAR